MPSGSEDAAAYAIASARHTRSERANVRSTLQRFAKYGLNFNLLPNYPDEFDNPRSRVISIGGEREVAEGFFAGADYVHQR